MATVVRMPSVIANATEGAIQSWLTAEGQRVVVGEPIVEIETEKAVVEYPSEIAGTVGRLLVGEGDNIAVGTPIAVILADGEDAADVDLALQTAGNPSGSRSAVELTADLPSAQESPPVQSGLGGGGEQFAGTNAESDRRVFASPIVRRLAKERGLDWSTVTGSGPNGRIVRRDLDRAVGLPAASTSGVTAEAFTDLPLTRMRRAIARRVAESKATVPHFYVTAHVDVDRMLELRREANQIGERKLSINDFVIKAVAGALEEVPGANAIWAEDHLRSFASVDIGIAVAVDGGLLTPVLRNVGNLSLSTISAEVAALATRARSGQLRQDELEGGTFSISNLGMYGVDEFSAIVNPPQSGILAVAAAKPRAVVKPDGTLTVATMMTVTLSADHRVIDGAVAAEWMAAFVRRAENPLSMVI